MNVLADGDILALPTSDRPPVRIYPVDQFVKAQGAL